MKKTLNKNYIFLVFFLSFIFLFTFLFSSLALVNAKADDQSVDASKIQSYKVTLDSRTVPEWSPTIRNFQSAMYSEDASYSVILEYETIYSDFDFAQLSNFVVSGGSNSSPEIEFNKISGANGFNFFSVGQRNRFTLRKNLGLFFAEKTSLSDKYSYHRFLKDYDFGTPVMEYNGLGIRYILKESTSEYKIVLLVKCYDSLGNDLGVYCDSGLVEKYDWLDYEKPADILDVPDNDNSSDKLLSKENNFDFVKILKLTLGIVLPLLLVCFIIPIFIKKKKKRRR